MTKTDIYQFDPIDANNQDLEGIDTATGWAPNQVGPAFRALMGRLARVCQGLAPWNAVIIDGAAATSRPLWFTTAFSSAGTAGQRWLLGANATAEAGSNAGSDLAITPYSDAGAALAPAVTVTRSTGAVALASTLTLAAGGTVTGHDSGGFDFRSVNGNYGIGIRNDGTNAYLMQTASGNQYGTYNAYRPYYWNLTTGMVGIDETGRGTQMGGTLLVQGGSTLSGTGAFMYGSGGTFTPTTWGPLSIGLTVTNGVFALGFFTSSDRDVKSDIEDITPEDGADWVMRGRPRTYIMDGRPRSGFIAQEDIASGRGAAVGMVPDERFTEDREYAPAGYRLVRNYEHDIAYLTAALQSALSRIDALEAK